ncbi:(2Fe-2S)-binding protein [Nakamurella leprariae]|uniref:(2Fe-2S)-binding protein n=1 Tax=Nakamurella leprariae TaxID=2803911 RepID=A0A938Y5U0_9ACTN|nr:(2Fe-2S)-binding protein [Nakamurella leprariae]MBM9466576.1 (2Fe-2S)-binding protein [Nakamurella leprariae]
MTEIDAMAGSSPDVVSADARSVLAEVLAAVPADEHGPLVPGPGTTPVPFARALERDWLADQIGLRGQRWGTDDPRTLATLWWYSASVWVQCPSLASLVVAGRALSPRLDEVTMHWLPDSRITGSTCAAVLPGTDQVAALGAALRETFAAVIPVVAELGGGIRERPLWAIASDSLANRLLWIGRAVGDVTGATALAVPLARAIGAPFPVPRYVDVAPDPARPDHDLARFTRRCSCCLLYEAPGADKCTSCPKRTPADRLQRLTAAAATLSPGDG